MDSIRVHLGPMPPMLRAMIDDLLTSEPDMTVVGNSAESEDSLLAASSASADVLIAQETSLNDGCVRAAVTGNPSAILTISEDGESGTGVSLIRHPVSLAGPGTSALADTVRLILAHRNRLAAPLGDGDDHMN